MADYITSLYQRKYQNQKVHICLPRVANWLSELIELMFPVMGQHYFDSEQELAEALQLNQQRLVNILDCQANDPTQNSEQIVAEYYANLKRIESQLSLDAEFFCQCDPACLSVDEVVAAYPGFYAVCCYRIANPILKMGFPLIARMITENAHNKTGVDIHPGATIGCPFFIDHATGVVVGETTVIGDRVVLYQGVTLGALRVNKALLGVKRHPTVEDDCVIYANATILGGDTVIGKNSIIGGNVWLASSVKPNSFVYHESIMSTKERQQD